MEDDDDDGDSDFDDIDEMMMICQVWTASRRGRVLTRATGWATPRASSSPSSTHRASVKIFDTFEKNI